MAKIVVGERVINGKKQTGVITSFDGVLIYVDFTTHTAKYQYDAFEKGFLKYENQDLQSEIDDRIAQSKKEETERKAEETRVVEKEEQKRKREIEVVNSSTEYGIDFLSVSVRLEPAPISLSSVRKKDRALIQEIFDECDKDTTALYEAFYPRMKYPERRTQSKYAVGFFCKYAGAYIFRVFSRNDTYSAKVRKYDFFQGYREEEGITVKKCDTTEIFRVLSVNGNVYYFSKNVSYVNGRVKHSDFYNKWQTSNSCDGVMINEVIKRCDCGYLNDYIAEENINCFHYVKLLMAALTNNKAEIVFKHKQFLSTYRIENIIEYLDEFSSKQIDVACKNNAINALPMMKRYGVSDPALLQKIEEFMKKQLRERADLRKYKSIYDVLGQVFEILHFDTSDLDRKVIAFLKKIEFFHARVYYDYMNELFHRPETTAEDFFDKDYMDRHQRMMLEKQTQANKAENDQYAQAAQALSWIDREENGYYIILPKTIAEFRVEGSAQHNCVYTGRYYRYVINKESIVVFLRQEPSIPYVTIEFDYTTFEVYQAYGKYNSPIDSKLYEYIKDLGKRLYCEALSHQ